MGSGYMGSVGREGENLMKEVILLAACGAGEVLPQSPDLPADVFTACLTTPIKVSPLPLANHSGCSCNALDETFVEHQGAGGCLRRPPYLALKSLQILAA